MASNFTWRSVRVKDFSNKDMKVLDAAAERGYLVFDGHLLFAPSFVPDRDLVRALGNPSWRPNISTNGQ